MAWEGRGNQNTSGVIRKMSVNEEKITSEDNQDSTTDEAQAADSGPNEPAGEPAGVVEDAVEAAEAEETPADAAEEAPEEGSTDDAEETPEEESAGDAEEAPEEESADDAEEAPEEESADDAEEPAESPAAPKPPKQIAVSPLSLAITSLVDEKQSLRDKWLRTAAGFENFKKRSRRDVVERAKQAEDRMVLDFLPVVDNLERALEHGNGDDQENPLVNGVDMVYKQFLSTLERYGITPCDAIGQSFDPEYHEAIQQMHSDQPAGIVCNVLQRGYRRRERLVRAALVVVSLGPAPEAAAPVDEAEAEEPETGDEAVEATEEAVEAAEVKPADEPSADQVDAPAEEAEAEQPSDEPGDEEGGDTEGGDTEGGDTEGGDTEGGDTEGGDEEAPEEAQEADAGGEDAENEQQ